VYQQTVQGSDAEGRRSHVFAFLCEEIARKPAHNRRLRMAFVANGQPFVCIQQVEDFRQIFAAIAPDVNIDQ
jgi:hypothetical protein